MKQGLNLQRVQYDVAPAFYFNFLKLLLVGATATSLLSRLLWALFPELKTQTTITALPQTVSPQTLARDIHSAEINSDKRITALRTAEQDV